jgi:uroporphyrinogen decarboxylase
LADWTTLDSYQFPPLHYTHWVSGRIGNWFAKQLDALTSAGADGMFDRLYFLRGFENLMHDLASSDPRLQVLIDRFQEHQLAQVRNIAKFHPDQVGFHTDIGGQDRLLLSPRLFRKYIKPLFKAVFQACRQANMHVYLHSDGHLLEIVDDLVECGVSVHDPQERANTIEGIEKQYKGKLCIDLDLDRQALPFSTPESLDKRIKRAVETLNSPEGGFMIKAEIADRNIPLENVDAICRAFETYCVPRK